MDFYPYSYETSIFTLGAHHEEVQPKGRQTKLNSGFTVGKLVQPSPGISIPQDSNIVLSKRSPELFHRAVYIAYFYFFVFSYKNYTCVKKLSEGVTACLFHLRLQAFVVAIMKL